MGAIEDIIGNGVSVGVQDAANKMLAGNATNETVTAMNTVLTTTLPWVSPINDASWAIFFVTVILLLLYYIVASFFKKDVAERVRAKYLSVEDKGSRAPGAIFVLFGDPLFIMTNVVVIVMVTALMGTVLLNSIFPTTLTIIGLGIFGLPLLIILAVATIFLFIAFYIYAVYLVAGLATIKTLGLMLFFNPNSVVAKKFLRLFFANTLFPLGLILLVWFAQLVGMIFVFPLIMSPIAPIFVSLWSCLLLYVIHTLAWDWNIGASIGRYRRNTMWIVKKAGLAAAVSTGNVAAVGAVAALDSATPSASAEESHKPGVKKR